MQNCLATSSRSAGRPEVERGLERPERLLHSTGEHKETPATSSGGASRPEVDRGLERLDRLPHSTGETNGNTQSSTTDSSGANQPEAFRGPAWLDRPEHQREVTADQANKRNEFSGHPGRPRTGGKAHFVKTSISKSASKSKKEIHIVIGHGFHNAALSAVSETRTNIEHLRYPVVTSSKGAGRPEVGEELERPNRPSHSAGEKDTPDSSGTRKIKNNSEYPRNLFATSSGGAGRPEVDGGTARSTTALGR